MSKDHSPLFHRTELLIGHAGLEALKRTRVLVVGVGGVGSWCAESLVRTGVGHVTLVDSDVVCITNVNRQLQATSRNVGHSKVEELRRRLLDIHPLADVVARQEIYSPESSASFALTSFDFVVDAIDSLSNKVHLIATCRKAGVPVFASMGAASRLDPSAIRVGTMVETQGCPLAKKVRSLLRRENVPLDFLCVYSNEPVRKPQGESACGTAKCMCPRFQAGTQGEEANEWCSKKAVINGSVAHITAIFGFMLAGLVVQATVRKVET